MSVSIARGASPWAGLPLLFVCAASPAAAQGDIIVTAARTADALEAVGVTVIDAEEIEILQPVSTLDLLGRVSGVREDPAATIFSSPQLPLRNHA